MLGFRARRASKTKYPEFSIARPVMRQSTASYCGFQYLAGKDAIALRRLIAH
jgi:hypothetical protein